MDNKIVDGAVAGFVAAVLVDFQAFRSWKSADDALAFDWKIALFRWVQGAVAGAVLALGFDAVGIP